MDGLAIPMLQGENGAFVKQRAHVRRIETQDARKRMRGVAAATESDERFAERNQRVEVIWIALEQTDKEIERRGWFAKLALEGGQLERCVGICRHRIERRLELARRLRIFARGLEQPGELIAHNGEIGIDPQCMPVRADRTFDVTCTARDIADSLLN